MVLGTSGLHYIQHLGWCMPYSTHVQAHFVCLHCCAFCSPLFCHFTMLLFHMKSSFASSAMLSALLACFNMVISQPAFSTTIPVIACGERRGWWCDVATFAANISHTIPSRLAPATLGTRTYAYTLMHGRNNSTLPATWYAGRRGRLPDATLHRHHHLLDTVHIHTLHLPAHSPGAYQTKNAKHATTRRADCTIFTILLLDMKQQQDEHLRCTVTTWFLKHGTSHT